MNFISTLLSSFLVKITLIAGASGFVFLKALTVAISAITGLQVH